MMKPFPNVIRLTIAAASIATAMLGATPAVAAPVLLGNGTLNAVNDLTVVQNGGQILEFLDLTSTRGQSVSGALTAYGADGFRWANGTEVAALFGAFGFAYGNVPRDFVILDVPTATAGIFVSYLGATLGDGTFGWIDDFTTDFRHTYACISVNTCNPNAFVENTGSFWPVNDFMGVYLVRNQSFAVPEPTTIAMFSLALVGLVGIRTRKSHALGESGGDRTESP